MILGFYLAVFAAFAATGANGKVCRDSYFACGSTERCIPLVWKCDNYLDCFDGSDEANCRANGKVCGDSEFACLSGDLCIPLRWKCNDNLDCFDGSDEANCPAKCKVCGDSYFACDSGDRRIPLGWKCNYELDCPDGSDEANCPASGKVCRDSYFACDSGDRCFPLSRKCNYDLDCPDGSDEANCPGRCSLDQRRKACTIFFMDNITLSNHHPSFKIDNASASRNILDMCVGSNASLSKYTCEECEDPGAPGGSVCLTNSLLDYLIKLGRNCTVIVNELAGACHSCNSRHYRGQAVDLHKNGRESEYLKECKSLGGVGLNETNHVHCQFT